ncbi:hypothetical protein ABT300_24870 [Streptomyces sp. NPDC001027]|uniref:hypothetical protein n=1 Tax=Streptomyces sp. NPDC001027 TaxID=3154771 RepID=UPI00332B65A6
MREERRAEHPEEQQADALRTVEQQTNELQADELQADGAEAGRRARFGSLPERVDPQDLVEERPATPRDPDRDAYDPDQVAIRYGL